VVYTYMIVYSFDGYETQNETLSAGGMSEALELFRANMRMRYQPGYKIHAVWLLLEMGNNDEGDDSE
jgi:hypothetical protein